MVKCPEPIETIVGNVTRAPIRHPVPKDKKDVREWLIKTEDLQLWGPFSYRELLILSRGKKLTRYDYIAKSCGSFDLLADVEELEEVVSNIPDSIFDETTDKSLDREISEATIGASVGASWRTVQGLFNFSVMPLNTFLWIILFVLVTSYCLYYVGRY